MWRWERVPAVIMRWRAGSGRSGDGEHVDEDGDEIGVILAQGGGEVVE